MTTFVDVTSITVGGFLPNSEAAFGKQCGFPLSRSETGLTAPSR
jgi:hypothetical protein